MRILGQPCEFYLEAEHVLRRGHFPLVRPDRAAAVAVAVGVARRRARRPEDLHCPGRKPPFWAVKRPARPSKRAIESRSAVGNATGA